MVRNRYPAVNDLFGHLPVAPSSVHSRPRSGGSLLQSIDDDDEQRRPRRQAQSATKTNGFLFYWIQQTNGGWLCNLTLAAILPNTPYVIIYLSASLSGLFRRHWRPFRLYSAICWWRRPRWKNNKKSEQQEEGDKDSDETEEEKATTWVCCFVGRKQRKLEYFCWKILVQEFANITQSRPTFSLLQNIVVDMAQIAAER